MAILRIKQLIEDLENNTSLVVGDMDKVATTAGNSGTASKATSAGRAGTTSVAHYASSGTAALAGTNAIFATGL